MPARLPLFPLHQVLFPGEPLPLHIFEPRYRQLLADCLSGDQRFGITAVEPPEPGALGTVARIRAAQALPDGRSNIVVLGERRFAVQALLREETPYPVAAVEEFDDHAGTAPMPRERAQLLELAQEYHNALGVLADNPTDQPDWAAHSETLTFQVAALAELEVEAKANLLATRSTRERTRALLELLPPLVRLARGRAEVHLRARTNGKGGPGHNIVTGT